MLNNDYRYTYTFRDIIGEHGLTHADGRVSVGIEFQGIDFEYLDGATANLRLQKLFSLIGNLDHNLEVEVHCFRDFDDAKAQNYLAQNDNLVRQVDICANMRQEIADHIGHLGMSNKIIFILSKASQARKGIFNHLFNNFISSKSEQELERLDSNYKDLLVVSKEIAQHLDAKLLSSQEIVDCIFYSIDKDYPSNYDINNPHNYLYLPEIAIEEKPQIEGDLIKYKDQYHKILVAVNYPDVDAVFISNISFLDCQLHYSMYLKKQDTGSEVRKSERATRNLEGADESSASSGLSMQDKKSFIDYVLANNLTIFANNYVLRITGKNPEVVKHNAKLVREYFELAGGSVRSNNAIQQAYFRLQTPTQLSKALHTRVDHQELITNLLPVAVANTGSEYPQVLRLTENNTLIGLEYKGGSTLHHGFTVGRSRCGKDVETQAQIFETFGLGYNWFILEIDPSYQFTVEMLGGNYLDVDPSKDNINPFPSYDSVIDQEIIDCTISAISPLILDQQNIDDAQRSVLEVAFKAMYSKGIKKGAPNLAILLEHLLATNDSKLNNLQLKSKQDIIAKLQALLATGAGEVFASEDNFQLSEGICGVNFRRIKDTGNKKAATFYLIFIILKFQQMAEKSAKPSFIVLNEIHEFSSYAPEVVKELIRSISRMGGKRGVYLKIVTQNIEDINLGAGVLGQMNNKQFVYMQEGHELVQERIPDMPDYAVEQWKSMHHPDRLTGLNYRQQFWNIGADNYYLLHVTLPQELVLLANTNPDVLKIKQEISNLTDDPIEKLQFLKERVGYA